MDTINHLRDFTSDFHRNRSYAQCGYIASGFYVIDVSDVQGNKSFL